MLHSSSAGVTPVYARKGGVVSLLFRRRGRCGRCGRNLRAYGMATFVFWSCLAADDRIFGALMDVPGMFVSPRNLGGCPAVAFG